MQKAFEKIIKKLEEARLQAEKDMGLSDTYNEASYEGGKICGYENTKLIVKDVAEEFAPDTNLSRVAWETIYRRLLEVIDEYAAVADISNVKDCKVLSDLLRHYKEQLTEEFKPKSFQITKELNKDNKFLSNRWIPVEEKYPDTKDYILLSFDNFNVPQIGRWEEDENGGAFYIGDEEETCVQQNLFVNAWQPIKPYRPEEN